MDFLGKIYSVTELTEEIKDLLEEEFPRIWVEGEISNFRVPPSGHYYFVLKDAQSQIRAVFFKSDRLFLSFKPEDGLKVLCLGRLNVYPGRGEYQIVLERMELKGWGALQLAFENLKERLSKEGLFDPTRKRALPILPRKVAVITSPTGAAVRDFLRILYRRFHNIEVLIYPVSVQGETASYEIEQALNDLNRFRPETEVIVLTRGGGSLEDLWPFNEERVARAIAASRIPVISAVGHEVDFTIADFVADLRASTPSAAAELLVEPQKEWEKRIRDLRLRLMRKLRLTMEAWEEKLFQLRRRLGDPRRRWTDLSLRLDDYGSRLRPAFERILISKEEGLDRMRDKLLAQNPLFGVERGRSQLELRFIRLTALMEQRITRWQANLTAQEKALKALSPLGVLERGYALVRALPRLSWVRNVEDAPVGTGVRISLARGDLDCRVEEVREREEDFSFVQRPL